MCLPFESPYSSDSSSGQTATDSYGQQAGADSGYYRDDRIARSAPNGTCTDEGSLECYSDGMGFLICDDGAWIDMGAVAQGTECEDGEIVATSS